MENPYQPPAAVTASPVLRPFRWRRVLAFAVTIYATAMIIGFSSGLLVSFWGFYGSDMEQAIGNARLARRVAYGVAGAVLYWRLAAPVRNRFVHVVAAFVIVQLIDVTISFFVFGTPSAELIDLGSIGRSLLAAGVGLVAAGLGSNNSFKPEPFPGSA